MQKKETHQQTESLLCANFCDLTSAPLNTGSDIFHLCRIVEEQAAYNRAYCNAENGATARMIPQVERIYVGSYFCDRFFLALHDEFFDCIAEFCHACDLHATLVIPIFSQSTLHLGKDRIENILDAHPSLFDEVTVNDYGMAAHLSETCRAQNMAMNWGRLFMKEPRDPRYAETSQGCRSCAIDVAEIARLSESFPLGNVELDPFAPIIDVQPIAQGATAQGAPQAAPIALHLPHCFMSTGHICEAASATCEPNKSFRANMPCALECRRSFSVSISEGITADQMCYIMKNGRTVFFENPFCEIVSGGAPAQVARIIWSPESFAFSLPEDAAEFTDFAGSAGFAYADPAGSAFLTDEYFPWQEQGGALWV